MIMIESGNNNEVDDDDDARGVNGAYLCKTNRAIGHCTLRKECPQLSNAKYTSVEDNKDCKKSNLIGDVVCCAKNIKIRPEKPKPKSVDLNLIFYRGRPKPKSDTEIYSEKPKPKSDTKIHSEKQKWKSVDLNQINPEGLSLLNKNKCGCISDTRIGNGVNAVLGEFPWMAILLYANRTPFCGGSIITDRYILTAAHCIKNGLHFVRLGEHNLSTELDCLHRNRKCRTYLEFAVDPERKPIAHPKYNLFSNYKDIALIKINGTIDFNCYKHIKPICLPTSEIVSHDADMVLAGWGLKKNNREADVLQRGVLKLFPLDVCKKVYKRYTGIDESKICVGTGENKTVSCPGDSGAPLISKTEYKSGDYTLARYTQIGLVSLGSALSCGESTSTPSLYENIEDSMPWITHTILS
ncbi:chymotrypsinogen A-like [Ceratitis capitata]|uniref:chymotrypsinogen A-like n=1 Tax=Ceratitis capitata TaxID=7213 RepID=UPI000A0F939E|nr:chymotrypsinogen A-like [Ceratitis capitata]